MPRTSLIVIDDFYEEPDAIRETALSLEFTKKPGATYPGMEAVAPDADWSQIRHRLRSYIDEPCDAPCPKTPLFPQGKFRLALEADNATRLDRVHIDQQRWSGVIYLTRPEHCEEGLVLYRHRPTGSVVWQEQWFQEHYGYVYELPEERAWEEVVKFFKDPEQFDPFGMIPMAYNRAVVFMAQVFHGTGRAFGTDRTNGRLSQHFEFYAE